MKCPKCGKDILIKYGKSCGKQRWKCKGCGCQFTRETPYGRDVEEKLFALSLLVSGMSMRAVADVFGVSAQTVLRWKKSDLINSDKVEKAERVTRIKSSGKRKIISDNFPDILNKTDNDTGETFLLETVWPSGMQVDLIVKRKKNIRK